MDNISTEILIIILIILFLLSAFFSGSETALMSVNKYKMRHQAKLNNKGAKAAKKLLENPDKIIGVILLGNNLTNIFFYLMMFDNKQRLPLNAMKQYLFQLCF